MYILYDGITSEIDFDSGDRRAKTAEDKASEHLHDRRRLWREEGQDGDGHGRRREGQRGQEAVGAARLSRQEERRHGSDQASIHPDRHHAKNQERCFKSRD